jgi:radical SAM superfamily enzyme YgiQ (UPF0313 family)
MKVVLVFPRVKYPTGDPPLGVAYLAASLQKAYGEPPAIVDTTFVPDPLGHIGRELRRAPYDLVCISAMVTMAREAAAAARLAKEINPRCRVIVGGPHPTTLPELALAEPAVDAVCVGEGEETLVEVVTRDSLEVPGLYRRGPEGVTGEPRPPIADLDALPFPALELLPMARYLNSFFQLDSVSAGIRGTSVLATRGCPFRCAYCQPTLDQLFGRGVRKRSPANVVAELRLRREQFGVGGFLFADDTFIADRAWTLRFSAELERSGLGLKWGCNVRADLADEELLAAMRAAGLRKIYVGIEVYDDQCRREVFNKKLTREQVERAVAAARRLGIRVQGYFMLAAPGQERRDVWDTIRYAWRLPIDDAVFNLTTPLPGTYLYERYRDAVALPAADLDYYRRYAFAPGRGIDERWLARAQKLAYAGFYGSPRRLGRQLRSLLRPGGPGRLGSKLRRVL